MGLPQKGVTGSQLRKKTAAGRKAGSGQPLTPVEALGVSINWGRLMIEDILVVPHYVFNPVEC